MPAWWRSKSKSKSKTKPSSSTARKKACASSPSLSPPPPSGAAESGEGGSEYHTPRLSSSAAVGRKEKAKSFDDTSLLRRRDPSPGRRTDATFDLWRGHPLPLPSERSVSSASSSGFSDELPDLGSSRFPELGSISRDRNVELHPFNKLQPTIEERGMFTRNPRVESTRCSDILIPQKREFSVHGFDVWSGPTHSHWRTQSQPESMFEMRTPSSIAVTRGQSFSSSPARRHDDLRSPRHPLPLPPPTSPISLTSTRSLQSQWKKGKMLGRGTFGHVYQGFNSESGQMCAIKEVTLFSDDSNSRESLKQLNQEISLLSHLSHPNIVQYYGSELVDDTLSVFLEYVSGGSIHKLLKEYGAFGEPVIRSYTAQLLSGLAYLHARNTVHRDIKGANILVDPNGEIKLADFGMAKHISYYHSIRSFKGSPYWMAPEVIMNGSGYNLSVDIWSLGCTVLEMATSNPPWSQFEGVAAIFKIGNSKDIPEIPDHLSSEGKHFLKLCLQRDPCARPTAAQLMDHPFVREHPSSKTPKFNSFRDILPSTSEGNTMMARESIFNRSASPLLEREQVMRLTVGLPSVRSQSDLVTTRVNVSLPVSPCSSPLRQIRQSNWSCLPSSPRTGYSVGPINHSPYSTRPSGNYQDPWLDLPQLKVPVSPKR